MIKTTNLTKRFGENTAVNGVSLEVPRGEVFGFLGPNGAGKTTTVRLLSALIGPSEGKAVVNGFDVVQEPMQVRRTVGVLTETPGMYDRLSAEYNLLIYARLYEVEHPEQAVQKYLTILELWDRRKEAVGGFSKGMKQKLAIARALLHEPQTVFLDEPTAGLDPIAARTVREFVEQLKTEGRTIFLTTHNLDEAERLCDRVGVMRSSLIAVDSPEALRRRLFGLKVRVQLANLADSHRQLTAELPFVHSVEVQNGALLVGAGARVQYVQPSEASLEDVYMQLVNGGEAQPAGRGK